MIDIDALTSRTPIDKGWSGDRKYRVVHADTAYLLRLAPAEALPRKQAEFAFMRRVAALGVRMCQPVQCGLCKDGAYLLIEWIDGEDAETALPPLSPNKKEEYGKQAGVMARAIHSLPAPEGQPLWEERFNRKIDRKIAMYRDCGMRFDGDGALLAYIENNRHLLRGRPSAAQHGDFHIGNMMLDASGALVLIDFDRFDSGDPWEEFNRIVWCAQKCPPFARGMVSGYFGGDPPEAFWRLLALYIASNTLSSLPWAIPFGQQEVDVMLTQARDVSAWYKGFTDPVPTWYAS